MADIGRRRQPTLPVENRYFLTNIIDCVRKRKRRVLVHSRKNITRGKGKIPQ